MTRDVRPELRIVLERLAYLARLRNSALVLTRAGAATERLRASDLAALVARDVDTEDSPWFRRDLTVALRSAGWRWVRRGGVRLWKGVALA